MTEPVISVTVSLHIREIEIGSGSNDRRCSERDFRFLEQACASHERLEPLTLSVGGAPFVRFNLIWCHDFRGLP